MNRHLRVSFNAQGDALVAHVAPEQLGGSICRVWNPSPSKSHRTEPYELPQTIRVGVWDFEETNASFSPPPFAIVVQSPEGAALVAVAATRGWHRWNRVDFICGVDGVDVHIDLEGQTAAESVAARAHVFVIGGRDGESRHDLLARGLAELYPYPRRSLASTPDWWLRPIYCGWGDQVSTSMWLEGPGPEQRSLSYCTQGLYERWIRRLEQAEVPIGTVIIDGGWSAAGVWEPDLNKWPDMRGFIDRQHAVGRRVLLWLATWLWEGLPDEWCVFAGDYKLAADPTHPEYRAEAKREVHHLLSPSGLNADGFKIDQLLYCPSRRWPRGGAAFGRTQRLDPLPNPVRLHGDGWGCELLYGLQKDIYEAAKGAKHDCLITSSTVHPYFHDTFDIVRLHDTGRIPSDIVAAMKARSDLARAVFPDKPIDADDWVHSDYQAWITYTRGSMALGVPCIFYAERFQQNWRQEPTTFEIPLEDLSAIAEVWRQGYAPARQVSHELTVAVG